MFTGIITHLGKLKEKDDTTFTFAAPATFHTSMHDEVSVAVNGVCLTVAKRGKTTFSVTVMPETLQKTMLGNLKMHNLVNLELPVTPKAFLSGHIVQGHVDGVGRVIKIAKNGNSWLVTIQAPTALGKYIVEKGSIAINGVSLAIIDVKKTNFTISIIPYTWQHTTFHSLKVGHQVNIEVDIIAKYIEQFLRNRS